MHTVSFSLAFYIVLRPQGIRKQMKTLRKRHRVHIALWNIVDPHTEFNPNPNPNPEPNPNPNPNPDPNCGFTISHKMKYLRKK